MKKITTGVRVHGRRLACENSKNSVFFDHIEWEDGQSVTDYMVVAPKAKTRDLVTGVSVLPVMEGKYGLIHVYRHPLGDYVWEVPRGFIDEGEDPLTAAMRELSEETGLECKAEAMRSMGIIAPEAGTMAARVQLFAALNCVQGRPFSSEEFGHRELRFLDSSQMSTMVANSEIQDPGTLVAYFRLLNIAAHG
jgi:ADP-ribose pyrophosphatase YjhB (NUDIX family)